jgi:hypothetical protein
MPAAILTVRRRDRGAESLKSRWGQQTIALSTTATRSALSTRGCTRHAQRLRTQEPGSHLEVRQRHGSVVMVGTANHRLTSTGKTVVLNTGGPRGASALRRFASAAACSSRAHLSRAPALALGPCSRRGTRRPSAASPSQFRLRRNARGPGHSSWCCSLQWYHEQCADTFDLNPNDSE